MIHRKSIPGYCISREIKPQKFQFSPIITSGRKSAFFKSNSHNIETQTFYQNFIADSNQILHNDKNQPLVFVGGPKHA